MTHKDWMRTCKCMYIGSRDTIYVRPVGYPCVRMDIGECSDRNYSRNVINWRMRCVNVCDIPRDNTLFVIIRNLHLRVVCANGVKSTDAIVRIM